MATNEFNENHWKFILKECETDQQRHSLEVIRDLCKASFKEYSDTRLVFYKNKKQEVAWIRLRKINKVNWLEIVIRLPTITKERRISKTTSKRYGFRIGSNGKPIASDDVNEREYIYQSKDFTVYARLYFNYIAATFLERPISQDSFENLTQLIRYAIQEYVLN